MVLIALIGSIYGKYIGIIELRHVPKIISQSTCFFWNVPKIMVGE